MEDAKCPVPHGGDVTKFRGTTNNRWWESDLSVEPLIHSNDKSNPYGADFDYVAEFNSLDLDAVKADIVSVMKDSKPWWPADYGHYGPFFVRMAWHSAGTYRVSDGRGGAGQGLQRFAPLNSWPDNVNLDKARRLLWPVKQKYGRKLSWADLMILAGNVALEDMGFKTFGFAGGRADVWEPDNTYWGSETEWLANGRYDESREASTLEGPLAAVQMGLIYVNPEGPDGKPDFVAAAADIRETFARMAMNDEETVALIAGGHAFGKTHGAGDASQVSKEPEKAEMHEVGLGWKNSQGKGHSEDTISSGLEVTWTPNPTKWDNDYLRLIFKYHWQLEESPAGAKQWIPAAEVDEEDMAPSAHIPGEKVVPKMLTTDLALRFGDEEYKRISKKFLEDFDYFSDAFARAWFKLTHRDMGPRSRYHGPEVPTEILLWQDPVPAPGYKSVSKETLDNIFEDLSKSGLDHKHLVKLAWASASTFRNTDKRGGANGARIALEPQKNWEVNEPKILKPVVEDLRAIALKHEVSLADVIVIAGSYAVKLAAGLGGVDVEVPITTGRGDATQEDTDVESFEHLRPVADGFRNWSPGNEDIAERLLIEKAALLGLTPPELTVLVGGLRVLGGNYGTTLMSIDGAQADSSVYGVLTHSVGVLDNSFFRNLLSNDIAWAPKKDDPNVYIAHSYIDGERPWSATRADLVFASNSVLRAQSEVYASDDAREKFVKDFVAAWVKVMNSDLFDI
jgi:catalase-peroxidase